MSLFEIAMLVCFGVAWPFSIARSYRSRSNAGKSVVFLVIVFLGYVSGSLHKILYDLDAVLALYVLNGLMVATDIALYYRNARMASRTAA